MNIKRCFLLTSLFLLVTVACKPHQSEEGKQHHQYLVKEVKEKLQLAASVRGDTLESKLDLVAFHKQLQNFILISKDIENLTASVNMANRFFGDLAQRYNFNSSDFIKFTTLMHVNEIENNVYQNELTFLTLYLLKFAPERVSPGAVH